MEMIVEREGVYSSSKLSGYNSSIYLFRTFDKINQMFSDISFVSSRSCDILENIYPHGYLILNAFVSKLHKNPAHFTRENE